MNDMSAPQHPGRGMTSSRPRLPRPVSSPTWMLSLVLVVLAGAVDVAAQAQPLPDALRVAVELDTGYAERFEVPVDDPGLRVSCFVTLDNTDDRKSITLHWRYRREGDGPETAGGPDRHAGPDGTGGPGTAHGPGGADGHGGEGGPGGEGGHSGDGGDGGHSGEGGHGGEGGPGDGPPGGDDMAELLAQLPPEMVAALMFQPADEVDDTSVLSFHPTAVCRHDARADVLYVAGWIAPLGRVIVERWSFSNVARDPVPMPGGFPGMMVRPPLPAVSKQVLFLSDGHEPLAPVVAIACNPHGDDLYLLAHSAPREIHTLDLAGGRLTRGRIVLGHPEFPGMARANSLGAARHSERGHVIVVRNQRPWEHAVSVREERVVIEDIDLDGRIDGVAGVSPAEHLARYASGRWVGSGKPERAADLPPGEVEP